MIKKRTRPPPTQRQRSAERDEEPASEEEMQEGDEKLEYVLSPVSLMVLYVC